MQAGGHLINRHIGTELPVYPRRVCVCCSYKGGGHVEDSQLVGANHHLGVILLQRAPRCLGQVGAETHAQTHRL